jgi:ElaA protein
MIQWQTLSFDQINNQLLYKMIKLRIDVFVVEQECAYPELDNKDIAEGVYHLAGFIDGTLVAVSRLIPAGLSYTAPSIGRVAIANEWRDKKLGHELVAYAVKECERLWPNQSIEIGAQAHLKAFYGQHGFTPFSNTYLEDGIPHIDMRRP